MCFYDPYALNNSDLYDIIQLDEEFLHRGLNYAYPIFQRKDESLWMMSNLLAIHGKFQNIIEIGSLYGANLVLLSKLCIESGYIIGVEPGHCGHFNTQHVAELLYKHKLIKIPVPSYDKFCLNLIATIIGHPMLNTLVYIDAFHSYDEVKRDWDIMMPLIGQACAVIFHDLIKEGPLEVWCDIKESGTGQWLEYISQDSIQSYRVYGERAWGGIGIYIPELTDK